MRFLMDPMTSPRQMLKSSLHYVERLKVTLVNLPNYTFLEFSTYSCAIVMLTVSCRYTSTINFLKMDGASTC